MSLNSSSNHKTVRPENRDDRTIHYERKGEETNDFSEITADFKANKTLIGPGGKGRIVYEVIRIIDRVPLFLNDHIQRFRCSCRQLNIRLEIDEERISEIVYKKMVDSGLINWNLKLESPVSKTIGESEITVDPVESRYPEDHLYKTGVTVTTMKGDRYTPNIKQSDASLRNLADKIIAKNQCFEVLLVNANGIVTEGSRSNVFFIKGSRIYTAPLPFVLPGITRKKLIRLAKDNNIDIEEKEIRFAELESYDAILLTGTSLKVLPVNSVNHCRFSIDHCIVKTLMTLYDICVLEDIGNAAQIRPYPTATFLTSQ